MATTWLNQRDKRYGNLSEHAAKVIVDIATALDLTDRSHRRLAVSAVQDVARLAKDAKTVAAAKAFLAKHDG